MVAISVSLTRPRTSAVCEKGDDTGGGEKLI